MRKYLFLFSVLVVICVFLFPGNAKPDDLVNDVPRPGFKPESLVKETTGVLKANLDFGKIPLYFISNQGQVNQKARFYAKASRYTLWVTKEGLVFGTSNEQTI